MPRTPQPVAPDPPQVCGEVAFPLPTCHRLPEEFKSCNDQCALSQEDALQLEEATIKQYDCDQWVAARRDRINASTAYKIINRQKDINENLLRTLFRPKAFTSEATSHGLRNEQNAKAAYVIRKPGSHIHDCGLVVNPNFSFIGATPDSKVCDEGLSGILEIKCPFTARNYTVAEAALTLSDFPIVQRGDELLSINPYHDHYIQVQLQLMVTGAPFCDYVVYTHR